VFGLPNSTHVYLYYINVLEILIVFQLMRLCWAISPDDRPAFRTLKEELLATGQALDDEKQNNHCRSIATPKMLLII